eukprot:g6430.t1
MYSSIFIALSFFILLWCCQTKGQSVDTSEDSFKDLVDLNSVGEPSIAEQVPVIDESVPASAPAIAAKILLAPLFAPESLPSTAPDSFEKLIDREISRCMRNRILTKCRWKLGFTIASTIMTYTVRISLSTCCCACRNTDVCDAVHYESSGGGQCVFHQGKATSVRERGTRRWIKR